MWYTGSFRGAEPLDEDSDRREFLRTMGRWFLAGIGIAGIGGLASRRCQAYSNSFFCRECPALRGCVLPQTQRYHAKVHRR